MPRKGPIGSRPVLPDPVYGSELIQRFINRMMLDGKKVKAEDIFYTAMRMAEEKLGASGADIFDKAISNVMPQYEVRPRRVGGQTYQVPSEVRPLRKRTLAIRWMVGNSRRRSGKTMIDKLAGEIIDAYNNTGPSVKKKEDTHRMADSNKAFSHYRF